MKNQLRQTKTSLFLAGHLMRAIPNAVFYFIITKQAMCNEAQCMYTYTSIF